MAHPEQRDPSQPVPAPSGFVALAVIAAAAGAAAALLLAPHSRRRGTRAERRLRREQPTVAAVGFLVGAGLTALFTPESGPVTRKLLSGTLSRIKVGTIDHIERLRLVEAPGKPEDPPVRTVQELGRDPDDVF
ncbi:MAG TPA: YtxH domain-containing protein [Gemmatimonadales bacterium]|nr:YtxH domain-containing protein [Gemmatimonadales bacterium]